MATFGVDMLFPKCHWLLHFAQHFERHGVLYSCFTNERYHRNSKRYADDSTNTSVDMSRNLLKETTLQMLAKMQSADAFNFKVGLIDGRPASIAVKRVVAKYLEVDDEDDFCKSDVVHCSDTARFNKFATCKKGDMVLAAHDGRMFLGKVCFHVTVIDEPLTLVATYSIRTRNTAAGYCDWTPTSDHMLLLTENILDAVIYCELGDGCVGILLPCDLR